MSASTDRAGIVALVDDDEEDAFILRCAVDHAHVPVEIRHYSDGERLLAALRAGEVPARSVILLDLNMPVMDGFTVLERLGRERGQGRPPVVVYSTAGDQAQVDRAYRAGADGFITKPGSLRETADMLMVLVDTWFRGDRSARPREATP